MRTIYIRNVDAAVLAKIDEMAAKKRMSRNKLVNIILETYVITDKVKEIDNKYSGLVDTVTQAINNNTVALMDIQQQLYELKGRDTLDIN